MNKVALLGLGTMGSGMAANWLKKGFALSIYNRTRAKARNLEAAGARWAASPREAAAEADVIVAMVADDEASRAVWLGEHGALAGAKRGAVAVEMSTLSPDWVGELAALAQSRGLGFLDAPVGGSKGAAAAGELILFVGGEAATLETARPALAAISARINPLGGVGAGAAWKLVNNWLIATQVAALGEALRFVGAMGFSPRQAAALIEASASASPVVKGKLPRMVERRFDEAEFSLRLMLKDARYAIALAERLGLPCDVVKGAAAAYARGEAEGLGDTDFAAVGN